MTVLPGPQLHASVIACLAEPAAIVAPIAAVALPPGAAVGPPAICVPVVGSLGA